MISFRSCQNLYTVATQLRQGRSHSSFSQAFLIESERQVRLTPWQLQPEPSKSGCRLGVPEPECPSLSARFCSRRSNSQYHRRDTLTIGRPDGSTYGLTSSTFLRLRCLSTVSFQLGCKHSLDIGTWFPLLNPRRCKKLHCLLQPRLD